MDFLGRAASFVRVVEAGSMSAAARSLGLSLAAMSRQMTTLEGELGASLLERTTRHQRLTEEGRRFLAHATALVREADAARASVRTSKAISGDFTLSASVSLGLLRIIPALPRLASAHPALRLDLRLEERTVELVGDGVDLAVRAGLALPDTSHVIAQRLATFPRRIVAAPRYLRANGTPRTVAALASHPMITGPAAPARMELDGESIALDIHYRIGTLVGIRDAAIAGLGIAVLPDFVTAEAIEAGSLKPILASSTVAPVQAHALYRIEARGNPRIDAVLAHLRDTLPSRKRERRLE
ncbi:MAG TPA: LysR family transcriptional regulator [Kofleriaceae bacterium]|jgi:DNA-binding transcriptional LysR family regulator